MQHPVVRGPAVHAIRYLFVVLIHPGAKLLARCGRQGQLDTKPRVPDCDVQ
jgi:hypothetical protein